MTNERDASGRAVNCCQVALIGAFQELRVWTAHTLYELRVIDAARRRVLVRGGRLFAEARPARLAGARSSPCDLLTGGIHIGLPLELHVEGQAIVTSPVRRIELQRAAS
jgi:hypothetical protein